MNQTHEYAMIGHSRAAIGRWLGVAASLVTAGALVLIGLGMAKAIDLGLLHPSTNPYAIPVTVTLVYGGLFFVFDRWFWKRRFVQRMLGIPDLSGKWDCIGITLDNETNQPIQNWEAEITVSQTWEKIKVHSQTKMSRSNSVAASIVREEGVGFVLMYSYRNEPRPGSDMKAHMGYCELHVAEGLNSASGSYFNSGGRLTHGTMELTRKKNGR